jgi:hypothetical protein
METILLGLLILAVVLFVISLRKVSLLENFDDVTGTLVKCGIYADNQMAVKYGGQCGMINGVLKTCDTNLVCSRNDPTAPTTCRKMAGTDCNTDNECEYGALCTSFTAGLRQFNICLKPQGVTGETDASGNAMIFHPAAAPMAKSEYGVPMDAHTVMAGPTPQAAPMPTGIPTDVKGLPAPPSGGLMPAPITANSSVSPAVAAPVTNTIASVKSTATPIPPSAQPVWFDGEGFPTGPMYLLKNQQGQLALVDRNGNTSPAQSKPPTIAQCMGSGRPWKDPAQNGQLLRVYTPTECASIQDATFNGVYTAIVDSLGLPTGEGICGGPFNPSWNCRNEPGFGSPDRLAHI